MPAGYSPLPAQKKMAVTQCGEEDSAREHQLTFWNVFVCFRWLIEETTQRQVMVMA